MSERELIQRILSGDAEAEKKLYDEHVDRVFRLAYRMTGDRTLAEDLTQDTFIRAFDRLASYRGDGPFGGWLHRIGVSVILSGLRRRKKVRSHEMPEEDMARHAEPVVAADRPDLRRCIDEAVTALDDSHRLVFVMHDMEGYTHQEIAAAMDTPVGTAKARLSRARAKLRAALTPTLGLGGMSLEME